MLMTMRNNRSLTFYQQTATHQSGISSAYAGGISSVAIANTSMVTGVHTHNINAALAQLRTSVIQRGQIYANNTPASRGGFMAENWHAESYNIDATIKKVDTHAEVPASHASASPDIKYGDGGQASLKYNADAQSSATAQTNPAYGDQCRIVPADQLDKAKTELDGLIDKNIKKGRTDAADIQQKTKDLLDDRIRSEGGVESTPLTKEQDMDLAKAIKTDDTGKATVDDTKIDEVIKDTGIKGKVSKAIFKNELRGLGIAVAIGAGVGMTIGFIVTLAQSGVTPESIKFAAIEGAKSGVESGAMAAVGYGIGRTIGEVASKAVAGLLENIGVKITEDISKMVNMGSVGALTIAVFSAYQFIKLKKKGIATRDALIQVGRQALFSLSLLAVSIAAQGIWGGYAGIIVSTSIGIIFISSAVVDSVHQRHFAEKLRVYTIDKCYPTFSL